MQGANWFFCVAKPIFSLRYFRFCLRVMKKMWNFLCQMLLNQYFCVADNANKYNQFKFRKQNPLLFSILCEFELSKALPLS